MQGRVVEVQRIHISVLLDSGDMVLATVRGDFHESGEYPKVGDFVRVSLVDSSEEAQAVIEEILPRTSVITRLDQETRQPQVLVANIDVVFIVMGMDGDYNLKRLERYLALAQQSDIRPVIVLNKIDLAENAAAMIEEVVMAAGNVPVHAVSAKTGVGLEAVAEYFSDGVTAVLLGSSGAGKSTITNWLLGTHKQETQEVRGDDSRGRHTTTTRQLFFLPNGGALIDTPGMRELGLVEKDELTAHAINEYIEELSTQCKFRNCDHEKSAGCAVLEAVEAGELTEASLDNYHKLMRERSWLADKSGGKSRFKEQTKKRSAQAHAAAHKKRLLRGG